MSQSDTIGPPGSWRRFQCLVLEVGRSAILLFAALGFVQFIWDVINYGR